ncbi:iron transporter FeoA [Betaproteobacteria bacterium]|nr:iron transporter FeoA [Betaproteobacteria bacterium]GHT91261.1 iron transporter FeoA [Betaproteobacteria bacterium]GHU11353.1 iron transporter FeoA [Betaproteobacteria bacterium]GHU14936.1 iron transporter FeoA [Betaproteobacteria bacterium]GHU49787.1 iron transporter FeoA [Betaproteobacteria bacterium]
MAGSLHDLKTGQSGRVVGFAEHDDKSADRAYRKKLLSMGLTRGVEFRVIRVAPMGDPVEIQVRGFALSLRKDEAAALQVDIIDGAAA